MGRYGTMFPLVAILVFIANLSTVRGQMQQMNLDPGTFDMNKLLYVLSVGRIKEIPSRIISATFEAFDGTRYDVVFATTIGTMCKVTWEEKPWQPETPINVRAGCQSSY